MYYNILLIVEIALAWQENIVSIIQYGIQINNQNWNVHNAHIHLHISGSPTKCHQ